MNSAIERYAPLCAPTRLLFGPGPSPVSPRVYQAMQQNVVGHLDPFFFQVADEIRTLLGYAYSTANTFNLVASGTGSSGMELAVANFTEPGSKFAVLSNGYFADRIGEMAARQGAQILFLHSGFDWQMLPSFPRPGPAPKHASGARYRLKPIDSAIRLPGRQGQGISTGRREYQHIIRFLYAEIRAGERRRACPGRFARYLRPRRSEPRSSTLGDARQVDRPSRPRSPALPQVGGGATG